MNRAGYVYFNDKLAGKLEKSIEGYKFTYDNNYLLDKSQPSISISFPKSKNEFKSKDLFSFFFGLLAEGVNKDMQCKTLKIDENDHFTRLLKTAGSNTIGAVTIRGIDE
jgi:serine/threonine-protein kinase HipA